MPKFINSSTSKETYPQSNAEVVFVGKSNVGKSSLINALYKKGLAYTGKTPGKTRLLNFYDIDDRFTVCDVPGYGYANRSEKELKEFGRFMEEYFSFRDQIKVVVLVMDIRRGISDEDLDMIDYLKKHKRRYFLVFNKIDKISNSELINIKREVGEYTHTLFVSSEKKTNIDELKKQIESYL